MVGLVVLPADSVLRIVLLQFYFRCFYGVHTNFRVDLKALMYPEVTSYQDNSPHGRGYKEEKVSSGIRLELMHRDHVESPLRSNVHDLTGLERIRDEVLQTVGREETLFVRRLSNADKQVEIRKSSRKVLSTTDSNLDTILPIKEHWRLQLQGTNYESPVMVTGAGYSMRISLGSPTRTFHAFVDTGSDLPWLQCVPCRKCFEQSVELFDPKQSTTYTAVSCSSRVCQRLRQPQNYAGCKRSCRYTYFYGDESYTSGDMALESLTIHSTDGDSLTVPRFAFGCGHNNAGSLNRTGASGIIGLGRGKFSFPSQLRPYIGSKFATCFVNRELASRQTSPLLFGDMVGMTVPGMQYTPMVTGNNSLPTFYYVNVEGISVGEKRVEISRTQDAFSIDPYTGEGGTILDSGSTITSLVKDVYTRVMHEFFLQAPSYPRVNFSKYGLELCFDISGIKDPLLPTLTFHLTNATWIMPSENVALVVRDENRGVYMCVALTQSKFGANIIGNIQQQNFQIVYDLANHQIGFAKVKCHTL
ncbi:hypothetical protein R1sor_008649 [Riccia sorocarpa]|uniref:Peptidase A1 domain-containing protein n=1 Tax=Riccia sorocarpa TaxID=122646 RepID=A0ABD3HU23_9MARC